MQLPSKLGVVAFWLSWPALWLYLHGSQRTRILIVCGDEVLVTRTWLGDGRWSLPGGGLHRGEDRITGLLREIGEEIGLELGGDAIRSLSSSVYQAHGLRFMCHYFVTTLAAKPRLKLQRLEITDAQWVRPTDVTASRYAPDVAIAIDAATERQTDTLPA